MDETHTHTRTDSHIFDFGGFQMRTIGRDLRKSYRHNIVSLSVSFRLSYHEPYDMNIFCSLCLSLSQVQCDIIISAPICHSYQSDRLSPSHRLNHKLIVDLFEVKQTKKHWRIRNEIIQCTMFKLLLTTSKHTLLRMINNWTTNWIEDFSYSPKRWLLPINNDLFKIS